MEGPSAALAHGPGAPLQGAQAPPVLPPPPHRSNAVPLPRLALPSLLAANLRKLGQLAAPQLPLPGGGAALSAAWGRAAEVLEVSDAAGLQVRRGWLGVGDG